MMKKWSKVVATSLVTVLAVGALAGCGSLSGDKKAKTTDKGDTPTLLMYQIGDKPKNYDQLMKLLTNALKIKLVRK